MLNMRVGSWIETLINVVRNAVNTTFSPGGEHEPIPVRVKVEGGRRRR